MNGKKINILSVLNDKLMVSSGDFGGLNQLFIISLEGRHLSTINTSADNTAYLKDATWTPRGNILYTISKSYYVTLMSGTGEVISYSKMQDPHCLSVSNNDTIYLADYTYAIYQSTNEGRNWTIVFDSQVTDPPWVCYRVIKITTNHTDNYWTVGRSSVGNAGVRIFSVDRTSYENSVTWIDINATRANGLKFHFNGRTILSHDGNRNIFLADEVYPAVHVFSANGQYLKQLQLLDYEPPYGLGVDYKRRLIYVGLKSGSVGVFKLNYYEEI